MSEKFTLTHIEIEKAIERAKAARAAQLRRYGTALRMFGSKLRIPTMAIAVILLISFGAKVLFFSAGTAEANTQAAPSASWPLP